MESPNERREREFREAIKKVCEQHGADMELTDDGRPYGMASPVLRFSFPTVYDDKDEIVADYFNFEW